MQEFMDFYASHIGISAHLDLVSHIRWSALTDEY